MKYGIPKNFYQKIVDRRLCINGQSILDVGTGTGVLPRNMYQYGAKWTATDISENQIEQAKILSKDMDIDYYIVSTEDISFAEWRRRNDTSNRHTRLL